MPLFLKRNLLSDVNIGIWKIEESYDDFILLYPHLKKLQSDILSQYKSEQRRCEVLAVCLLINEILGDGVSLLHKEDGCPFLSNGVNISISHTRGFAVIIVSMNRKVSVDIEYFSQRVLRIKDKFMRNDEHACSLLEYLIHWCTKETLYKMFSDDKLSYKEMQLLSITENNSYGVIVARNILRNQNIKVYYNIFNDILLTYSVL